MAVFALLHAVKQFANMGKQCFKGVLCLCYSYNHMELVEGAKRASGWDFEPPSLPGFPPHDATQTEGTVVACTHEGFCPVGFHKNGYTRHLVSSCMTILGVWLSIKGIPLIDYCHQLKTIVSVGFEINTNDYTTEEQTKGIEKCRFLVVIKQCWIRVSPNDYTSLKSSFGDEGFCRRCALIARHRA